MAVHIVEHLEHEVAAQMDSTEKIVHVSSTESLPLEECKQNPQLKALDLLKKRMTVHV